MMKLAKVLTARTSELKTKLHHTCLTQAQGWWARVNHLTKDFFHGDVREVVSLKLTIFKLALNLSEPS